MCSLDNMNINFCLDSSFAIFPKLLPKLLDHKPQNLTSHSEIQL